MTTSEHEECEWDKKFFLPQNALVCITVFGLFIGLVATIGNFLVAWTIYKKPSLRVSHIYFIGCLASADLFVGVVTVPFYSAGSLTWPFLLSNHYFEMVLDFLIFQSLGASTYSLLAVSYDRYLAITNPLLYPSKMTTKKVVICTSCVWIIATLIGSTSFMFSDYESRPAVYFLAVLAAFVVPFTTVVYLYIIIIRIAKQQSGQIAAQKDEVSITDEQKQLRSQEKQERKRAMTVAIVIGTFAVFWFPNVVISLIHFTVSTYSECEAEKFEQLWLITLPFAFLNSAVNPIIYAKRNEYLRQGLKDVLNIGFLNCLR